VCSSGDVPRSPDLQPELGADRVEAQRHNVEMFPGHDCLELPSLRRFLNPLSLDAGTIQVLRVIEAVLADEAAIGRRTGQTVIQHR
jgi:hypothetical protein